MEQVAVALSRQEKAVKVDEVCAMVAQAKAIIVAEYRGLDVESITRLRSGEATLWAIKTSFPSTLMETWGAAAKGCAGFTISARLSASDNAADLGEHNLAEMVTCIRLCLDCAEICTATAGVTSRLVNYDPAVLRPLLESCLAICRSCGDECERHAAMPHCRICAQACHRCEQACRELLAALN